MFLHLIAASRDANLRPGRRRGGRRRATLQLRSEPALGHRDDAHRVEAFSVPALGKESYAEHRGNALGQCLRVHRPVRLREHGQDHQAQHLVAIVLSHGAEA